MKLFPPEPDINLYNQGFGEDDDILQRRRIGQSLSNLLENIEDPLVVALDGQWGTGKSYFLKRWIGAHTLENGSNATTVYFDAYANDYIGDPLPALVSALAERLPKEDGVTLDRIKTSAFKLAKPLARMGLSIATFGAKEAVSDFGDAVVDAVKGEVAGGMEDYWADELGKRAAMSEFRSAIETLVTGVEVDGEITPLVFVIDELDRCRPNYALEVLEIIKHFFDVPHVQFVLGVNLKSLENSVKVSYGHEIDAQAYLKKFIRVSLELPQYFGDIHNQQSAAVTYLEYLVEDMEIPQHLAERLVKQFERLAKVHGISLRETGAVASSLALASSEVLSSGNKLTGWIDVFVDLAIARIIKPDLYPKLVSASISKTELTSYLGATNEVLSPRIGHERNPNYDHGIFIRYQTWCYLIGDGKLGSVDQETQKAIGYKFSTFGMPDEAKSIPLKIHRDWLDRFSFYKPESQ